MGNKKRIIIAIVAVIAIIAGAVVYTLFAANDTSAPKATGNEEEAPAATPVEDQNAQVASVIAYDGSSFSLSESTVASGSNVKITNDSTSDLDFGSDPHPTHTDNPELNAGSVAPHESKTIKLTAKGKWGFHNHFDPAQHGFITVK